MNRFTYDIAAKSENLNSISILRLYKRNTKVKTSGKKSDEPSLTQKQISKQLGFSDSTIQRVLL